MLNRNLVIGGSFVIALGALAIGYHLSSKGGASRAPGGVSDEEVAEAPRYEVDPMWPKPLPNH